jgi:hypothetical protein
MEVPASVVFGEIIPVDDRGLPRQFAATILEAKARTFLDKMPWLTPMLDSRAAKAGLPGGDPFLVLDFVKGVTSATQGGANQRSSAKDNLLARRGAGPVADGAAQEPKVHVGGPVGQPHGLY